MKRNKKKDERQNIMRTRHSILWFTYIFNVMLCQIRQNTKANEEKTTTPTTKETTSSESRAKTPYIRTHTSARSSVFRMVLRNT